MGFLHGARMLCAFHCEAGGQLVVRFNGEV